MRKLILISTILLASCGFFLIHAQNANCELPLTVYMADGEDLPASAGKNLYNKLHKLIIENGVSEEAGARFVVSSNMTIMDKQILAGPPKSFIYDFELNLYIGDIFTHKLYNYATINLKGIGQTEQKAYNDAVKKINVTSSELTKFVTNGKEKIVDYYNKNYNQLIKEAQVMANQKNYEEAIYTLMSTPTCCVGYDQVMTATDKIYKAYVNQLCLENLNLAKSAWVAQQNVYGAEDASQYLTNIYPDASCYKDAQALYNEIKAKVKEDWKFEMKMYNDQVSLESQRINAWKEVGIAFGKNQPNQTTSINWVK